MITDPNEYFLRGCDRCDKFDTPDCATKLWAEGLATLRALCLQAGLEETAKWGHPCYMFAGRNIALFGAFRDTYRLSFFNPALMTDPAGVLQPQGPNSESPGTIKFTENGAAAAMAETISAYLQEAKSYAAAGILPPKVSRTLELPDELVEALDADPALAEAFHALTPGRQKSYVINLNGAKKAETRIARIAKFRDKILAGKGALDR